MSYTIDASIAVNNLSNQPSAPAETIKPVPADGINAVQPDRERHALPVGQGKTQSDPVSVTYKDGNTIVKFKDSAGKVVMQVPTDEYLILRKVMEDSEKKLSIKAT